MLKGTPLIKYLCFSRSGWEGVLPGQYKYVEFPTPAGGQGLSARQYLPVRRLDKLPVVGLQVVELVELHADVLDGQLEQVPEAGQVLCGGPRVCVHILPGGAVNTIRPRSAPSLQNKRSGSFSHYLFTTLHILPVGLGSIPF